MKPVEEVSVKGIYELNICCQQSDGVRTEGCCQATRTRKTDNTSQGAWQEALWLRCQAEIRRCKYR